MRIGVYTWGSEGDVRPFVALCAGLVQQGHDVELAYVLVNDMDLAGLCAAHGVRSRRVAQTTTSAALARAGAHLDGLDGKGSPLRQLQAILEGLLDPATPEMFEDAMAHMPAHDVVVAHFLHHPAATAAHAHRRPVVYVLTAPTLPTREWAPLGTAQLGPLNLGLWRLVDWLAGRWFLPRVNALRIRVGLRPLTRMFAEANPEVALALTCVSPTLFAQPRDWPAHQRVVGFFDLAVPNASVPADVEAMLAAGPPPVLMTFGSMLVRRSAATDLVIEVMLDAAARLDRPVIVQVPEHARARYGRTAKVLVTGALPHAQVMPRCAVVVHHGGAGTTQAAMRAARPSVVVPFLADQFFWASRLQTLGVTLAAVPRRSLTAPRLARAVRHTLANAHLKLRAAQLADAMRAEDGVRTAVHHIEALGEARPATV